jgi:hypothetical protein
MDYGTTAAKPGVQKSLLKCLINMHTFRHSHCYLVDISSHHGFPKILGKKMFAFFA